MDVVVVPRKFVNAKPLPTPATRPHPPLPDDPVDVRFAFVVKQLVEYLLPDRRIYGPAPPWVVPYVKARSIAPATLRVELRGGMVVVGIALSTQRSTPRRKS